MNPWILASRPKTLAAAIVPVLMGTALAHGRAAMHWPAFLFALASSILIQVGTNFVNDALDFKKGTDTSERLGPIRVTQAGLLGADTVLRGAYLCFVMAAACGVPLILRGGWPILVIGLASIAAAYAYTGGPYPLAYHGLGELFVIVFFGFVSVGGSYYLQTRTVDVVVLVAGFAAGSLAVVLIAINNLRDIDGDRKSNKKTMAVRLGERGARLEIAAFALLPFLSVGVVAWLRGRPPFLLALFALPVALLLVSKVSRSRGVELNRCLAMAGGLQWIFGILFVAGALL